MSNYVDVLAVMDGCIAHAEKMATCLRMEGNKGIAKMWDAEIIRQKTSRDAVAQMIDQQARLKKSLSEMIDLRDASLRSEVNPLRSELDIVKDARAALARLTGGES